MKSATRIQPVNRNRLSKYQSQLTEQINAKAYEIWGKQGRKNGNDRAHWLELKKIIKGQTF